MRGDERRCALGVRRDEQLRERDRETRVTGVVGDRRLERASRCVRFLRRGERERAVRRGRDEPVEERLDLRLRDRAGEAVDHLTVAERVHGRDALDAELLRERLVAVDVDLREHDLAAPALHRGLEHRAERPARTAPCRPEVDDDGDRPGAFDHRGGEVGHLDVDHVARAHVRPPVRDADRSSEAFRRPPPA